MTRFKKNQAEQLELAKRAQPHLAIAERMGPDHLAMTRRLVEVLEENAKD